MTNELFLIAAYLCIWGGVSAYLIFANTQQQKLIRRLQILEDNLTESRAEK